MPFLPTALSLSARSLNISVEKRKEDKAKAEAEAAVLSDLVQPAPGAAEDAGSGMDMVGTAAEGWMWTGQISRDGASLASPSLIFCSLFLCWAMKSVVLTGSFVVSAMKKKFEKEAVENET